MKEKLPVFYIDRSITLPDYPKYPLIAKEDYYKCKENLEIQAIDDGNDSWIAGLRLVDDVWVAELIWSTWNENGFVPIMVNQHPDIILTHFNKTKNEALISLTRMYKHHHGEGDLDFSADSFYHLQNWLLYILEKNKSIYGLDYTNPILASSMYDNKYLLDQYGYLHETVLPFFHPEIKGDESLMSRYFENLNSIKLKKHKIQITNSTHWGYVLFGSKDELVHLNSGMIDVLRLAATYFGEVLVRKIHGANWIMSPELELIIGTPRFKYVNPFDIIYEVFVTRDKGNLPRVYDHLISDYTQD